MSIVLMAVLALACAAGCAEPKTPPPESAFVANPAAASAANPPAPIPAQTPPEPPPPPPVRKPVDAAVPREIVERQAPADGSVYFDDDFVHGRGCGKGSGQRGFGWGEAQHGKTDSVIAVEDRNSPSGCALAFIFQGNPDFADDAWAEQRFRLGKVAGEALREVFIGFVLKTPANYSHRDAKGPDNNKLLRLWDREYSKSMVHLGMSATARKNPPGTSQMIVEYGTPRGTGNFNTGPWVPVMRPGSVDTVGYYARTSSGIGTLDGVIRVWWNRKLVYEQTNLPLAKAQSLPGAYNGFGNGYLLGWANSGFTQRTELRVWRFLIAPQPVEWFLPSGR